jgi:hypothetical protein
LSATAFVHLEVAPANPPQRGRIDEARYASRTSGKHPAHAGVKEQGLIVLDEEMVELQVELGNVNRKAEDIRCDFVDVCHG